MGNVQQTTWPYIMQPGSQRLLAKALSPKTTAYRHIGYGGPKGGGKASKNSSMVLTPYGFRRMGDIKVGDRICDSQGSVQRVLQVHPQGEQDIYKVQFTTGATTYVTLDHLWTASISANSRKRDGKKVTLLEKFTTAQLKEHLERNKTQNQNRWPLIPLPEPVKFTKSYRKNPRTVDPYLLGLLLGDGSLTAYYPKICGIDAEVKAYIESYCAAHELKYQILKNAENRHKDYFNISIQSTLLIEQLQRLGVYGKTGLDKYIPECYKYATLEDRKALVRGLMDTDGTVDSRGHMSFTSVSEQLAADFQWLIRSLGGKATIWQGQGAYKNTEGQRIVCNDVFTVQFNTPINNELVGLERKKVRTKDCFNGGLSDLKLRMESITYSHREEATCITVSNANSLYITDDFIVTHNSFGARGLAFTLTYHLPIVVCIVRSRLKVLYRNHINPAKNELRAFMDAKVLEYNDNHKMFTWKHTHGTVMFAHAQRESDIEQFDGIAADLYIFEESGHFTETMVKGIWKNNRPSELALSAGTKYRPRTLQTFNWGGRGHAFNRRIFWDKIPEGQEDINDYLYIFASLYENKAMLSVDPEYDKSLKGLPDALMRAYLLGDPNAFIGAMFSIVDEVHQVDGPDVLKPFGGVIPAHWSLVGSLDAAAGGGTCSFGLYAITDEGRRYKLYTYYAQQMNPQEHTNAICDLIESEHSPVHRYTKGRQPDYIVADRFAFQDQDRLGLVSNKYTFEGLFQARGYWLFPVNYGRITAMMALQTALHFEWDNGQLEIEPELQFFRGYNDKTLKELREAERDEKNPEDIAHGPEVMDHAIDETKNFILAIADPPKKIPKLAPDTSLPQTGRAAESAWLAAARARQEGHSGDVLTSGSIEI